MILKKKGEKMFSPIEDTPSVIKWLVFGESGAGKTHLAKTWHDTRRVFFIDLENGSLTARYKTDENGERVPTHINVVKFDFKTIDGKKIRMDCEDKKAKFEAALKWAIANLTKDDLLVIDSLTELAQITHNCLKIKYPDKKDSMALWGEFLSSMMNLVSFIKDLPINVLITSLMSTELDVDKNVREGLLVSGQAANLIPPLFDEVYKARLITKEDGTKINVLVTQKENTEPVKSRGGILRKYEKPDLAYIRNRILGIKEQKEIKEKEEQK